MELGSKLGRRKEMNRSSHSLTARDQRESVEVQGDLLGLEYGALITWNALCMWGVVHVMFHHLLVLVSIISKLYCTE